VHRIAAIACIVPIPCLTGCGVGVNCAPPSRLCGSQDGNTARYTAPPRVERVVLSCCDPELAPGGTCDGFGEWWGDVNLQGTANRVVVTILTDSEEAWTESHTLSLIERDPAGFWEIRFAEWDIADIADCDSYEACADRYEASSRSLLDCTDPLSEARFVVEVFKGETEAIDCITWGTEAIVAPTGCRSAVDEGVLY